MPPTLIDPPTPGCPKRMVFGPCGGVRGDGSCELDAALPCPWCDASAPAAIRAWPRPESTPPAPDPAPVVLTDLTAPPYDLAAMREILGMLAPVSDGLLVGDDQHSPDFPPTMLASEILAAGGDPWITLTCRDRNRVVLEQELAGLAELGVAGVLCVTGDGRGFNVRPEVTQVFDLDSTRLAHLAATAGVPAAVAISPAAPPAERRAEALAEKQRAGATLAIANHVGSPGALASFLAAARHAGADIPVIASVAVYTDEHSAAVLSAFPGLALDPEDVAAVLGAPDPRAAGIDAAVAEAEALLEVPGVVGVNLSGRASAHGWRIGTEVKAEIASRLSERWS
jgi:methylenetetrahydrofolate reductase (NADPH)